MSRNEQLHQFTSIVDILSRSAANFPNSKAFSDPNHTITYAELDRLSTHLAHYLSVNLGMCPGDRIAIQLNNIVQYPIALYGALKAGLIIVNTNPLYTQRETIHQFNDAGVKTLIVLDALVSSYKSLANQVPVEHVISVSPEYLSDTKATATNDFNQCLFEGSQHAHALPKHHRSSIAFLQYTGGTTGLSKGAMLTHHSVLSNIWQTLEAIGGSLRESEEIMIVPLPLYHIYACAISVLIMPFIGAESVLIPNPKNFDAFIHQIKDKPFSIFAGINTLFIGLTQHSAFESLDFSHLKLTISGGTALTQSATAAWSTATGCSICEAYGMTEASPVITFNDPENPVLGCIGKPVANTDIKIVASDNNTTTAENPTGELWVKGPQVMQGYWQQPEETAKTITTDGWLKTGDIVTQLEDGLLKIVDRKKDMIIVSGFNVYPNEIEDVITQHDEVLECGVIGMTDEKTGEQVMAFVVKKNENLNEDRLKAHCKKNLTGYKTPRSIHFISELPKSNVGKILRKELRKLT